MEVPGQAFAAQVNQEDAQLQRQVLKTRKVETRMQRAHRGFPWRGSVLVLIAEKQGLCECYCYYETKAVQQFERGTKRLIANLPRTIKRNSRAQGQMSKHLTGFTMIEIMIVVVLLGLLAAIAVPNFIRSRTSAQTNVCINNLRTIDYAIQQWALEEKQQAQATVHYSDISSYLKSSVLCPAGGTTFEDSYSISAVGAQPLCQRIPSAHLLAQTGLDVATVNSSSPPPTGSSDGSTGDGASGSPAQPPGNGHGNSHHGKP